MKELRINFPDYTAEEQEKDVQKHWKPVAKLDPYENTDKKIKDYHESYIKLWEITEFKNGGR